MLLLVGATAYVMHKNIAADKQERYHKAEILAQEGHQYFDRLKIDLAIEKYKQVLKLIEDQEPSILKIETYKMMGDAYDSLKEYKKSAASYEKAVELSKTSTEFQKFSLFLQMIHARTVLRYDAKAAISSFENMYPKFIAMYGDNSSETACFYNFAAMAYKNDKDYKKAETFYKKSLAIYKELQDFEHISFLYCNISRLKLCQNDTKSAKGALEESASLFNKHKIKNRSLCYLIGLALRSKTIRHWLKNIRKKPMN